MPAISTLIAAAGVAATAGSALVGSQSAGKAADAQENASNASLALQREQWEKAQADSAPWLQSGQNALAAYNYEMGLGPRPVFGAEQAQTPRVDPTTLRITTSKVGGAGSRPGWYDSGGGGAAEALWDKQNEAAKRTLYNVGDQQFGSEGEAQNYLAQQYQQFNQPVGDAAATGGTEYGGFTATPGYQFRVDQGQTAIERSAAARGGLNSGRTLKALNEFGQGIASAEHGTFMNRLGMLSGTGQTQANNLASLGQNFANAGSNALMAGGQARASGYANQGNIMGNAMGQLGGFAGNYLGGMSVGGGGGSIGGVPGYGVSPVQGMPGIY